MSAGALRFSKRLVEAVLGGREGCQGGVTVSGVLGGRRSSPGPISGRHATTWAGGAFTTAQKTPGLRPYLGHLLEKSLLRLGVVLILSSIIYHLQRVPRARNCDSANAPDPGQSFARDAQGPSNATTKRTSSRFTQLQHDVSS